MIGERGSPFELAARALHTPDTPWEAPEDVAWLTEAPLDILQSVKGGTLFLREIGQLSKLEQRGLALLCARLDKYDARLVCASTRPLPQLIAEGQFDADLFQALSGITVSVPALREQREDIPEIAKQLLQALV